jgi:pyruvate/2-oxoglutarate dehydrogenase complex dihydrolipoamide dehydrogenase (E3) component
VSNLDSEQGFTTQGVATAVVEDFSPDGVFEVDLFVIGGGSGGIRAALVAAGHGAKVMLAEEYRLGGTCVIRGCVPKKLFVYAGRFSDSFVDAADFGWKLALPHFDWPSLVAAKDREITRLEGLYGDGQDRAGVEVVRSRAVLEDAHTVRLLADGRLVRARTILIATGARPELPQFDGIELGITSDGAFDLKVFPKRFVIGGAGYIAMEFAGLFSALGSDVTVVCRGRNVLRGFDEDIRQTIASVAVREGHAFADSVFGRKPRQVDYSNIPTAVFSSPEIGTVGLTELEARMQFPAIDVYKTRFRPLKAAVTGDCESSLLKLVVDCETDRILGIHIFAEDASEMIQVLAIAVGSGATMKDFMSVMAVHPTLGEEIVTMQAPTVRYDRRDAAAPINVAVD